MLDAACTVVRDGAHGRGVYAARDIAGGTLLATAAPAAAMALRDAGSCDACFADGATVRCAGCGHSSLAAELRGSGVCPLCHARLAPRG